jgi:predicted PurR-regulated permease PerM
MVETTQARDLTRTVLAVLFLALLLVTSLWILQPFLPPLSWAALLVVATWPVLVRVQSWYGGRRWLAVATMLCLLLLAFLLPLGLAVGVLVDNAPAIATWVKSLPEQNLPGPPAWVADLPWLGERATESWRELASSGPSGLRARITPYADELAAWLAAQIGGAGLLFVHFLLTLLFAGVLYARGEAWAETVRGFVCRLAGDRGDRAAVLAAQATRAVALGVVITALVQAAIGGLGLIVAGVPVPGLLTAVMFVASVAQVGAAPVLALSAVWLFANDHPGWGVAMVVWAVLVGSLDNVIRPILIRKGVDLPLLLVFLGVVGGLIAFGVRGLFLGPVVLAVAHTLLTAWIREPAPTTTGLG